MSFETAQSSTRCNCCGEPIRWVKVFDGDDEWVWVDGDGRNGCPDPQQPDEGLFPHDPMDATAEWEQQNR